MSNVIHFEFGKKNDTQEVPGTFIDADLTTYLDSLRELGVDEDDILETFDSINDMDVYFAADDEVKAFADGWFKQFL